MKPLRWFVSILVLGAALAACGQSEGDGGACSYPPGATPHPDAAAPGPGCFAGPSGQICEVATDGQRTCSNLCAPAEYQVTCTGELLSGSIPVPLASLGCRILPLPTPSNVLNYCCPCAN